MIKELNAKEKMQIILDYASKINKAKELDILLFEIANMGKSLLEVDRCTMWLYNEDKNILWTKVAHGIPNIEISADTGVVGQALKTKEIILSNDPYSLPYFNQEVDKETGYKTKSLLTIPLFNDLNDVIGIYQCVNKLSGDKKFDEEDSSILQMVAGYAENALVTALLANELETTQSEIILLMAEIGESRSRETGNHVKRVARVSCELAKLIGMDKEEIKLIESALPMHDIGKVAIPDSILNKPGKLTFEEFEEMKTHAEIGYNLLKNSSRPIMKAAAIIAHEHHEKWNGKGYPRGISGKDIHLYGRITAIADVFDALASERCYKPAWEIPRVKKLFEEEQGQHFDPELTKVFLENFDRFVEILNQYKD